MRSIIAVMICAMALSLAVPATAFLGLPETLEGTIESISENTLSVIREKGATHQEMVEIQINGETQFEATAPSLEALQVGDTVRVQYKEEDEGKIALSVAKVMKEDSGSSRQL